MKEKCSDTLVELQVYYLWTDFLGTIIKPFKNVKTVILNGGNQFMNSNSVRMNFSEMFPAVSSLTFNNVRTKNTSKFALNYPHLEHLSVLIQEFNERVSTSCMNERVVMELIRMNPQIQSIDLTDASDHLLEMITHELPMLKQLQLNGFIRQHDNVINIHFEHVKSFTIGTHSEDWQKFITFSNELEVFENADLHHHDYIAFMKQYRHLKHIKIHGINYIDNNAL